MVNRAWMLRGLVGATRWAANSMSSFGGWLAAYPTTAPQSTTFEGGKPRVGGTGDMALAPNLTTLMAQGRHLERGTCMGRAVTEAWRADLVGTGIDIYPDTGDDELNNQLREALVEFWECACVDGTPIWEWQALMVGQLPPAGAALTRVVVLPQRVAEGLIPLALLPLEIEWLSELPVAQVPAGNLFVRGIELDALQRPVAYHLRNPMLLNADQGERVPAEQIIHVFEKRRSQQSHGEPVLSPAIERILQDDRLVRTELKASINTAAPSVLIKSDAPPIIGSGSSTSDAAGEPTFDIPPGSVSLLRPGQSIETVVNNRPSQLIDPFRGTIRGDVAAACRVNRQHLDRDYQRSTFMNSRMSNQDTDRLQASVKSMLCRALAGRVYELAFPWLLLSIGHALPSNPRARRRLMRYIVRPDERPYIDPVKDVKASKEAVDNNFSSRGIELSARGKDFKQVLTEIKTEQRSIDEAAVQRVIELQKQIETANAQNPALKLHWSHILTMVGAATAPGAYLSAANPPSAQPANEPVDEDEPADQEMAAHG